MKKLVILLSVFLVSIAAMSGCSSKEKELPFGAPQKALELSSRKRL